MTSRVTDAFESGEALRCSRCGLRHLCLPAILSATEIQELEQSLSGRRSLRKGEILYRIGDPLEELTFIRSGGIKLISSQHGREQVVGFYLPGEVLGLEALQYRVHTCRAVALEPTVVCVFPHQRFRNLCRRHAHLMDAYEALTGRELSHEHELLLLHGQHSALERLCYFLISMATRRELRGATPTDFRLPMNRDDLGNYLGLAPETLSRLFKELAVQGLVSVRAKRIRLLDLPGLKQLLDTCRECPAEELAEGTL